MTATASEPFIFYARNIQAKSFYDPEIKAQRYFLSGHIDSEDMDLVDDIITRTCMKSIEKQCKSRSIKLDFDHESLRDGKGKNGMPLKLINLSMMPLGRHISDTLDSKGNFLNFELNSDWKQLDEKGNIVRTFMEVWRGIQRKFYDAFSVAFVPKKAIFEIVNGKNARKLDDIALVNVALTGSPINPNATVTDFSIKAIMAKSLAWLEEKNKTGDRMVDDGSQGGQAIPPQDNGQAQVPPAQPQATAPQQPGAAPAQPAQPQQGAAPAQPASQQAAPAQPAATAQPQASQPAIDQKSFAEIVGKSRQMEQELINVKSQMFDLQQKNTELQKVIDAARPAGFGGQNAQLSQKAAQGQQQRIDSKAATAIGTLDLI